MVLAKALIVLLKSIPAPAPLALTLVPAPTPNAIPQPTI